MHKFIVYINNNNNQLIHMILIVTIIRHVIGKIKLTSYNDVICLHIMLR